MHNKKTSIHCKIFSFALCNKPVKSNYICLFNWPTEMYSFAAKPRFKYCLCYRIENPVIVYLSKVYPPSIT